MQGAKRLAVSRSDVMGIVSENVVTCVLIVLRHSLCLRGWMFKVLWHPIVNCRSSHLPDFSSIAIVHNFLTASLDLEILWSCRIDVDLWHLFVFCKSSHLLVDITWFFNNVVVFWLFSFFTKNKERVLLFIVNSHLKKKKRVSLYLVELKLIISWQHRFIFQPSDCFVVGRIFF